MDEKLYILYVALLQLSFSSNCETLNLNINV